MAKQRSKMRGNIAKYGQRGAGKSSYDRPTPTMDFESGKFNPLDEALLGDFDEYGENYDYGQEIRSGGKLDPGMEAFKALAEALDLPPVTNEPNVDLASPEVQEKIGNYIMSVGIDDEGVERFANPYKLGIMKARERDRLKYNPSDDERPSLNTNFEDWAGHYMNFPGTAAQLLTILYEKINESMGGNFEGEYANPRRDAAERRRGDIKPDMRDSETPMYQEDWYRPNIGRILDYSPNDPRRRK